MREVYGELARETARFVERTALRCPPGCALCCTKPSETVETSVLEMMPVAQVALEAGIGDALLREAETLGDRGRCVFYRVPGAGGGECAVYELRGLTCRLFGYSGVPAAKVPGGSSHYACSILKGRLPGGAVDVSMPSTLRYRTLIEEIDPVYGRDLYGINEAVVRALRILGLPFFYSGGSGCRRRPA